MRNRFVYAPAALLAAGAVGVFLSGATAGPVALSTAPLSSSSLIRVADEGSQPPAPQASTETKIQKQQGKAVKGEEKAFADGKLKVNLSDIQPHAIKGTLNGKDVELKSGSSKRLLVGDDACEVTYLGPSGDRAIIQGGCAPATDADKQKIGAEQKADSEAKKPKDVVASAPEGSLKNPYTGDKDKAEEGHKLFLASGCNGCHGGTGGGGMCPPLTNDTFVYGDSDDILFRLITLGSGELLKSGKTRIGHENVVGPMPPFGDIIQTDQDLWKIITFIRSVYAGDPARTKDWQK